MLCVHTDSPSPILGGLVTLPETKVLHPDGKRKKVVNGISFTYACYRLIWTLVQQER